MGSRKHRSKAYSSSATPARCAGQPFWMYGRHPVLAGVRNPRRRFHRLLATREAAAEMAAAAEAASAPLPKIEIVEPGVIAPLVPGDAVHQGFAGLARPLPATPLDSLLAETKERPDALLVVLDQVTDPRNIGAVLRSAAAFAASAVVLQDRHAPAETGALAKAASGALETVPLIRVTNLARTLRALQGAQFQCVGFAGDSPIALDQVPPPGRLALVLGAEGTGLRRLVRETCDTVVRIPIAPAVESLNLSVAAAIALYECRREGSIGFSPRTEPA